MKRVIKRLGSLLTAIACAVTVVATSFSGTTASAENTKRFATTEEMIQTAAPLLGTKYALDSKGYRNFYEGSTPTEMTVNEIRNGTDAWAGMDCSGLIYYILTKLGYSTSGFSVQNPVPYNTYFWYSQGNPQTATISRDGITKQVNWVKYNESESTRAYYLDADGNVIPKGTIVIGSIVSTNISDKKNDHMWIYLGQFSGREAVVDYLNNLGVDDSLITQDTVYSVSNSTHWRLEARPGKGVVINNDTSGKVVAAYNMYGMDVTSKPFHFGKYTTEGLMVTSPDDSRAVYGIYEDQACTKLVDTITLDKTGKGTAYLDKNVYYVKELTPPTGWEKDTTVRTVYKDVENILPETETRVVLNVNKSSEDGKVGERTFKLTFTADDGSEKTETKVTDSTGVAKFENLFVYAASGNAISYTLEEVLSDDDAKIYVQPSAMTLTLESALGTNNVKQVSFSNKLKKGKVQVTKIDKETKDNLKDAVFEIVYAEAFTDYTGTVHAKDETAATLITGDNGYAETDAVLYINAKYILKETGTPKGYIKGTSVPFEYNPAEDAFTTEEIVKVLTVDNEATETYITKYNITGDKELPGAHLKLFKGNQLIDEWDSTTSAHLIKYLEYNTKYTLVETISPDGFVISNNIDFTIDETDGITEVNMYDDTTKIEISKTSAVTGKELKGATLSIYDKDNKLVETWVTGNDGVDTNGELKPHFIEAKLKAGETYTLKEESSPDGYVIKVEAIEFTVSEDGSIDKVNMENKPTNVEISKVDATTGKELKGAVLSLYDSEGKLIETWTSGEDGEDEKGNLKPHVFVAKLKAGATYKLVEDKAPAGYSKKLEEVEFTVSKDGTIDKVKMENEEVGDGDMDSNHPNTPNTGREDDSVPQTGSSSSPTQALLLICIAGIVALGAKKKLTAK